MIRGRGDERPERDDGALEIAIAVLGVARPVAREVGVAAGRIAAQEAGERDLRLVEIAAAQRGRGTLVRGDLVRVGHERLAVQADLLRLDLLQAVVDALDDVLLVPLHVGQILGELLVGTAQLGELLAQLLVLVREIQQRVLQLLQLLRRLRRLRLRAVFQLRDARAQVDDRAARLVVVEQTGVRARAASQQGGDRAGAAHGRERARATRRVSARHDRRHAGVARAGPARIQPHDRSHYLLRSSTRRFFAHADSSWPSTAGRSLP